MFCENIKQSSAKNRKCGDGYKFIIYCISLKQTDLNKIYNSFKIELHFLISYSISWRIQASLNKMNT